MKKLLEALKRQDWVFLALEVVVVIFSILVAFELERWGEERRDRKQELSYLLRLKDDLQIEIAQLETALGYAEARIAAAHLLEKIMSETSSAARDPAAVAHALETASWRSFPTLGAFVWSELQNSGNFVLLASDSLRRALAEHYAAFRHFSRVGLDRDVQQQFDRATAGILTSGELAAIEDRTWRGETYEISTERAVEIAVALQQRPEAVALIPSIVQHHVFNTRVIEQTRASALDLIAQIDRIWADRE